MVFIDIKKQKKQWDKGTKMITLEKNGDQPVKSILKQLKLVNSEDCRRWNRNRIADQIYFVMTYHQFRKKTLRQFCKTNTVKISQDRNRKEEIVKLIWEHGFTFDDIYEFVVQNAPKVPENAETMLLTERIQIKSPHQLEHLFKLSKNLYNKANRLVHAGFHQFVLWNAKTVQKAGKWVRYMELVRELNNSPEFQALPTQTSQKILQQVEHAWDSFFKAYRKWKAELNLPKSERLFTGRPHPPGYKEEDNLLTFTNQQCRIKKDKPTGNFYLHFPKRVKISPIKVNKDRISGTLMQVRILPRQTFYIVEIVYKKQFIPKNGDGSRKIAIDLGVRNIVCMVNNIPGVRPIIVRGGVVKSINSYYNKQRAHYQKIYKAMGIEGEPRRLVRLTRKRNNKIEDVFHKLSDVIIEYCEAHRIGMIIIGYNPRWQQESNMGKRNNQNFVNIPFYRLIQKIQYKAELEGIEVELIEESHTSKCSFLDEEPIEHHETYLGQRGVYRSKKAGGNGKISHGLFKTAKGQTINADVNGAYNILRKTFPKFPKDGIKGLELVPIAVKFSKKDQDFTQLKQLANLISSTNALPKTSSVDGREIGGVSIGEVDSQSIKFYTK